MKIWDLHARKLDERVPSVGGGERIEKVAETTIKRCEKLCES